MLSDIDMKKVLLLLALVCLPILAQTEEKQHYIYNIVTFSGSLKMKVLG